MEVFGLGKEEMKTYKKPISPEQRLKKSLKFFLNFRSYILVFRSSLLSLRNIRLWLFVVLFSCIVFLKPSAQQKSLELGIKYHKNISRWHFMTKGIEKIFFS